MTPEQIKAALQASLADCDIQVELDGSHVNILAVGDLFEGKRAVQRQQMLYGVLNEHISSGVIHAVNMKIFTRQEWQDRG